MDDTAANHATNQRVTNALLGQKMDQLSEASKDGFASVNSRLDKVEGRLGAIDVSDATSAEWRRKHEKEHDGQQRANRVETIIGSVLAAAAGIGLRLPGSGA